MTRLIGHLALVALLLSCPVLCGTGAAACCDAEQSGCQSTETSSTPHDCCHQAGQTAASCDDAKSPTDPATPPENSDGSPDGCLCDGAVASNEDIARAIAGAVSDWCPAAAFLSAGLAASSQSIELTLPPLRPKLGLAMRIEQMSLLL